MSQWSLSNKPSIDIGSLKLDSSTSILTSASSSFLMRFSSRFSLCASIVFDQLLTRALEVCWSWALWPFLCVSYESAFVSTTYLRMRSSSSMEMTAVPFCFCVLRGPMALTPRGLVDDGGCTALPPLYDISLISYKFLITTVLKSLSITSQ